MRTMHLALRALRARAEGPAAAQRSKQLAWFGEIEAIARGATKKAYPYHGPGGPLDARDIERATALAMQLVAGGGPGMGYALENVLTLVLSSEDPSLVGFWERIAPPRHEFGRRDTTATMRAALACLALREAAVAERADASSVLLHRLPKLDPSARGIELLATVDAFSRQRGAPIAPFIELAQRMAVEDEALQARYLARQALVLVGLPAPLDASGAVFRFALAVDGFSCAIELAAGDPIEALHTAIQDALGWDDDHLWCLHLDGARDPRFAWSPDGPHPIECLDVSLLDDLRFDRDPEEEDEDDHTAESDASEPNVWIERVGELGLRPRDKILYRFDFGANHRIPLRVVQIEQANGKGGRRPKLPRIVEPKGKRPVQYQDPW